MPRKKADEKGEGLDLYMASARDALSRASDELARLAHVAIDEGLMPFAGQALIAQKMVKDIAASFPGGGAEPKAKKARKPRAPKADSNQFEIETNGASATSVE